MSQISQFSKLAISLAVSVTITAAVSPTTSPAEIFEATHTDRQTEIPCFYREKIIKLLNSIFVVSDV